MRYCLFFLIALLIFSCQEEITLDLPQAENKLVVEGGIEPGFPPYIILTKNQGYFDEINIDTYNDLFVNNADTVKVWCFDETGEKYVKILDKVNLLDSFPPIYTDLNYDWSGNSIYEFSQEERTYYLEIKWNNQIITAETYIPKSTPLDCLWVEQRENASKDYKCDIKAIYSDPIETQNNILIKSKRIQHYTFNEDSCKTKNKPDFPLKLVDAGSDILINGETFETYFGRPNDGGFPTAAYNAEHSKECTNGTILERDHDIVLIKFCQIDEPSLKFWRGLVRQAGTNGNPFAEPLNLVSNINGGLGIWTGYSPVYYKVPIIKNTVIFEQYTPNIEDIF
ncbi:MAG: DUF4249 family protein [Bacteroidota bacterium]|nr:DUF4249 family protein [Bacteroidota bacterium]